ncbi:STAS domain-containing protein [Streptomyces sp. SLBN-31]|uniref:STAS domain-containing protein n=1 Tax=Streptomyces sp. SLBN-31 TaxID=2768444 RepID=UPI0011665284|nr:STAS domain-containing protein [Streptomyces sp. SLBN-31]TQJ92432.1 anti-anti-sigma factor [Streptomyces sp. SLBN-31]
MATADDDKTMSQQLNGHAPPQSGVTQYERGGAWIVVAHGAYDLDSIDPLANALETAAAQHARVVVDASGLTFADSTFLNLLLTTHRQTDLRVAAPPPQLLRVLEITGADTLLDLRPTVEDAVD